MQFDADDGNVVRGDQAEEATDGDEADEDLRLRQPDGYTMVRIGVDGTETVVPQEDWGIIPLPAQIIAHTVPQQRQPYFMAIHQLPVAAAGQDGWGTRPKIGIGIENLS